MTCLKRRIYSNDNIFCFHTASCGGVTGRPLSILKETLINCLHKMKLEAHGTQKPWHIIMIAETASAAQRADSPSNAINRVFT